MSNFNHGSNTYLKELLPNVTVVNEYFVDLIHKCCGGRKTCENSMCPPTACLEARVSAVRKIDATHWVATVTISGQITYLPHMQNSYSCDRCPRTDGIYINIEIPFTNTVCNPCVDVDITQKALAKVVCDDCSLLGDSIEIEGILTLTVETSGPASNESDVTIMAASAKK